MLAAGRDSSPVRVQFSDIVGMYMLSVWRARTPPYELPMIDSIQSTKTSTQKENIARKKDIKDDDEQVL